MNYVRQVITKIFSPYYSFQASFDKENNFINETTLITIQLIKTNTVYQELPISLYKREIVLLITFLTRLLKRLETITKQEVKKK